MAAAFRIFLFIALLCLPTSQVHSADVLAGPIPAKVLRVLDGDTLEVSAQIWLGQQIQTRVRLAQIDTPELRGKCDDEIQRAHQAQDILRQNVNGRKIFLKNIRYGKYSGRILADLETEDGHNPADLLLQKGLARPYNGAKRLSWCP